MLLSLQAHHGTLTCWELLVTWLHMPQGGVITIAHRTLSLAPERGSPQMDCQVAEQALQKS